MPFARNSRACCSGVSLLISISSRSISSKMICSGFLLIIDALFLPKITDYYLVCLIYLIFYLFQILLAAYAKYGLLCSFSGVPYCFVFVLIKTTPFAAFCPYRAIAAESFSTVMLAMLSGFNDTESLAIIFPFMTYKGWSWP